MAEAKIRLLQRQLCGYFRDSDESIVEAVIGLFLLAFTFEIVSGDQADPM
jgi:hypothetical protein